MQTTVQLKRYLAGAQGAQKESKDWITAAGSCQTWYVPALTCMWYISIDAMNCMANRFCRQSADTAKCVTSECYNSLKGARVITCHSLGLLVPFSHYFSVILISVLLDFHISFLSCCSMVLILLIIRFILMFIIIF